MFEMIPFAKRNSVCGYNPFREMENLERSFFGPFYGDNRMNAFRTDVQETDDAYILESDLPGFKKEDIDVQIQDDILTIRAERHAAHEDKEQKNNYVRVERSCGSFTRSFEVSGVDTDAVTAKYENGVLTLTLPKKAPEKPASRKLTIE